MDVYTLLVIGHLFGSILGVGGATFIEVHLNRALKDGDMDPMERSNLKVDFFVTRIGMALGILTGIGFVALYVVNDQLFRLMDGVFWAKLAMVLIIVVNAILLDLHKIGLYWGSAFSFVSWWGAALLGVFLSQNFKILPANPTLSFIVIMIAYGVVIVVGAKALHMLRERGKQTPPPPQPSSQSSQ